MATVMIGFRVSEVVNNTLKELAEKRGLTVSAYVKARVEDFVTKVAVNRNNPINKKFIMGSDGHIVFKD